MAVLSSVRGRILLWVLAASLAVSGAAFLGLRSTIDAQLDAAIDVGLRARAADVAGDYTATAEDPFAQVVSPTGRVIAASTRAPREPLLDLSARPGPIVTEAVVPALGGKSRVLATPAGSDTVIVATPLADTLEARDRILGVLLAALGVLAVAVAAGSWMLLGAALRPGRTDEPGRSSDGRLGGTPAAS